MEYRKQKQINKQKQIHIGRQLFGGYQRGRGWTEDEMVKGAQLCGDEWKPDFWW